MADFRKLFLALAVLTLVFTTVASAQPLGSYSCNASSGAPLVRSEGITEYVGDILLSCTGVIPSGGITANVRVQLLNTNQTSIVVGGSLLESVLIVDELVNPRPYRGYYAGSFPDFRQDLFQGTKISDTEVEFDGVVFAAAGSTAGVQQIRIKNIRANASALGAGGTVFAVVNITGFSGTTAVTVNNSLLRVADVRQGLVFYTRNSDHPNTKQAFVNCQQPGNVANLNFKEGFASAFRVKLTAADHSIPDGFYGDESGFNPGTPATGTTLTVGDLPIGQATQGTRLLARFTGVPSGVQMHAPGAIVLASTLTVNAVSGPNSDWSGGSLTTSQRTPTSSLLYEVVLPDPVTGNLPLQLSTLDTVVVPVTVIYGTFSDPAIPGPATATVTAKGSFAPLSTTFTTKKVGDAPAPRFLDTGVDEPWWSITPCRTILLFPFVTNQAGFDTGIAIANTSADPLGTPTQAGACTLSYYGTTGATGAAPVAQTTSSIPAGSETVGTLSSGGSLGFPATPAFQGYMFAICNFQFAHGFAFVSDMGAQKLAMGYLPLVVPDKSEGREPADSTFDSELNDGEQLNN